jgi:hypothetical protein
MSMSADAEIVQLLRGFTGTGIHLANAETTTGMAVDGSPPVGGTNNAVPQAIIFGSKATGNTASDMITKDLLVKLPPRVLALIVQGHLGPPQAGPEGILMLGAAPPENYEILIRLKGYLERQTYVPEPGELHDIAPDGSRRPWIQKDHKHALKVAPETARLLRKEAELYLFAYSVDYPELRKFVAHRIASGFYPYSTGGILDLVVRVYPRSIKARDILLSSKILDLLHFNFDAIVSCKDYVPKLDEFLKGLDAAMQALFQPCFDVFKAAQKQASGSDTVLDVKILSPDGKCPPTKPRAEMEEWEGLSTLAGLAAPLTQGRLYMAENDGFGSLLSSASLNNRQASSTYRNDDFRFKAGEFFLLDTEIKEDNRRNRIVTNSRGQKGSVFAKVLVKVSVAEIAGPLPASLPERRRPSISGRLGPPRGRKRRSSVDRAGLDVREHQCLLPSRTRNVYRPGPDREERSRTPYRRRSRSPSRT